MSATSSIEWTDRTWNPVRGCSIVSPGCVNCYAMKQAHRFSGPGGAYEGLTKLTKSGPQWTGVVRTVDSALLEPLSWRTPQRVFVNSMSDLFHEDVPDGFIDRVFAVMASSRHTFQVLTKRPERMRAYMQRVADGAPAAGERYASEMRAHFERYKMEFKEGYSLPDPPTPELRFIYDSAARQENRPTSPDGTTLRYGFSGGEFHWRLWPLSNVWLGCSVENQHFADERIPLLLQTPAAVRFLSCEPLLGPIEFSDVSGRSDAVAQLGRPALAGIDWVIVGGESGSGARPFDLAWGRGIVQQCKVAGVACFVKQLGAQAEGLQDGIALGWVDQALRWHPLKRGDRSVDVRRLRDKKGGDPSEWPEDLRVRQMPGAIA